MNKSKKDSLNIKKFYVYPEDKHTNDSIRLSFDNWEGSHIFYHGSSVFVFALTRIQIDFLEKSKAQNDLKYIILTGTGEDGYNIWRHPKAKIGLTSIKAIGAITSSRKNKKERNNIKISFYNLNGRAVKLARGDYLVYSRVEKIITFLKGGAEPLLYGGREGINFTCEKEAVSFVEKISAILNRPIEMLEQFDFVIFRIS